MTFNRTFGRHSYLYWYHILIPGDLLLGQLALCLHSTKLDVLNFLDLIQFVFIVDLFKKKLS